MALQLTAHSDRIFLKDLLHLARQSSCSTRTAIVSPSRKFVSTRRWPRSPARTPPSSAATARAIRIRTETSLPRAPRRRARRRVRALLCKPPALPAPRRPPNPPAFPLPARRTFALGTLTGLTAADVQQPQSTAPFTGFSNLAPAPPANGTTQFRTMKIGFATGSFTGGKILRFTVGRGAEHSSSVGNGASFNPGPTGGTITQNPTADVFGGGVRIPENQIIADGMRFTGTMTDGSTFDGV